jgi:hypothetical protein
MVVSPSWYFKPEPLDANEAFFGRVSSTLRGGLLLSHAIDDARPGRFSRTDTNLEQAEAGVMLAPRLSG